jgi:hypothetical protein
MAMEFKRLFTRAEAESALPLVRQIVADILATAGRIRELDQDGGDLPGFQAELQDHLREMEGIGCFYKDWSFSVGLVDFPAEIDGETVFLCWRSDESGLGWYHGVEEGFKGRRPLPKPPA